MTREEALEALTSKNVVNPYLTLEAIEIAIDALKERAERKTGKWEYVGKEHTAFFHRRIYRCSACGDFLDFDGVNCGRGDANYCPNCGAKMEVDDADSD